MGKGRATAKPRAIAFSGYPSRRDQMELGVLIPFQQRPLSLHGVVFAIFVQAPRHTAEGTLRRGRTGDVALVEIGAPEEIRTPDP